MINGISDRQSTHPVQEPRSWVQTKARMLCFCMRHLPRPPLCTQKRRRNSKVNWKQKFWRLSVVDQERQYSRSGQAKERGTTRPPSPVLSFTADVVWRRHITLTMLSSPKSISNWCNVREAWQIAGRRGGVDLWLTSVPLRGVLLSRYILWTARAPRNITQGIKLSIEQLHTFPSL